MDVFLNEWLDVRMNDYNVRKICWMYVDVRVNGCMYV